MEGNVSRDGPPFHPQQLRLAIARSTEPGPHDDHKVMEQ